MALDLLLIVVAFCALWAGAPVGITLGGTALLFATLAWLFGAFDAALLWAIPLRIYGIMTNPVLTAIPLFVLMGLVIERSGLAEDCFAVLNRWLGKRRGGLSLSVTALGTLLAATTGIVGASVVTLGLLALPALLKRGVAPGHAGASIAAAGTLGQIIPPAIVLIVLADQMSNAWQQVQLEQGNFAPQTLSVTDFFAAALVPGLLLAGLIAVYQWVKGDGEAAFEEPVESDASIWSAFGLLALVVLVLGAILGGIATPTEASAVGAVGALLLAAMKLRRSVWPLVALIALLVLLGGKLILPSDVARFLNIVALVAFITGMAVACFPLIKSGVLNSALEESVHLIAMIFLIVIGASIFALVFRGLGGAESVSALFANMPGGAWGGIVIVLAVIFVLGFFLEFLEITYLVIPIVMPVLFAVQFSSGATPDPLWLGVLVALVLQTSFLTPPFGVTLFYLRGVAPVEMTTLALYRGVIPFVGLQLIALVCVLAWPSLATWLPSVLFTN